MGTKNSDTNWDAWRLPPTGRQGCSTPSISFCRSHLRQRGYNQSEWIARGIRSVTGIAVDTSSLSRIKKTESQTRKQIFERSENVEDIFRVENTDTLKNKHILLVDDVITTGSTMNACAEAMKAISGIRISILGIAVA